MRTNLELKAYCKDLAAATQVCRDLGAHTAGEWVQIDTYYRGTSGRLKLRRTSNGTNELISYFRADEANSRQSSYNLIRVSPDQADGFAELLSSVLSVQIEVRKRRTRYELPGALVNLDELENLGRFLEIEVFSDQLGEHQAEGLMAHLRSALGIQDTDILPWSYSQISAMYSRAAAARAQLVAAKSPGSLFLIDGCSGSGKTTVISRLASILPPTFTFARRHSTRAPRHADDNEYLFVSGSEFQRMKDDGEFLDCKDFLFGMSYGLAWGSILPELLAGRNVIAPINWGNALHVKRLVPEAQLICLTASEQTIRERLLARGIHRSEEIEERLGNARRFSAGHVPYDLTVLNETGKLDRALTDIVDFIYVHSTSGE